MLRYSKSLLIVTISMSVFGSLGLYSVANSHNQKTLLNLTSIETKAEPRTNEGIFFGPKITPEAHLRNVTAFNKKIAEAKQAEELRVLQEQQKKAREVEEMRIAQEKAEQARILAQQIKAKPRVVTQVTPPPPVTPSIGGSKQDWMRQAGIPESDWFFVDYIVLKESGWRPNAVNASSGATGLCQSLPASKMASAGADYLTNPITQLRWCHNYAISRYGGWANSYSFWIRNHWW